MSVAIQTPFKVMAKGGVVHVGGGGDFLPGVGLIACAAIRTKTVRPAPESVHVVTIPVEALDQFHLGLDEKVTVWRVPTPQHMLPGHILRSDRFFAGRTEHLPIPVLLLQPRRRVHAT